MEANHPSASRGADNPYFPSSQPRNPTASASQGGNPSGRTQSNPPDPSVSVISQSRSRAGGQEDAPPKSKKKHRRNKRRRHRRPSFAAPTDGPEPEPALDTATQEQVIEEEPRRFDRTAGSAQSTGNPLYRFGQSGTTLSNTSLESEALLDHR